MFASYELPNVTSEYCAFGDFSNVCICGKCLLSQEASTGCQLLIFTRPSIQFKHSHFGVQTKHFRRLCQKLLVEDRHAAKWRKEMHTSEKDFSKFRAKSSLTAESRTKETHDLRKKCGQGPGSRERFGLESGLTRAPTTAHENGPRTKKPCSDITNDQLGISGETGHGGANLCVY